MSHGHAQLVNNCWRLLDTFVRFTERFPTVGLAKVVGPQMEYKVPLLKPIFFNKKTLAAIQGRLGDGPNGPRAPVVARFKAKFISGQNANVDTGPAVVSQGRREQPVKFQGTDNPKAAVFTQVVPEWFVYYDIDGGAADDPQVMKRIASAHSALEDAALDFVQCSEVTGPTNGLAVTRTGQTVVAGSEPPQDQATFLLMEGAFDMLQIPFRELWIVENVPPWKIAWLLPNLGQACLSMVRLASSGVIEEVDARRQTQRKPTTAKARADGPFPPNGFSFSGNEGTISRPKVWKLLRALWEAEDNTLEFHDLANPVWGDREELIDSPKVSSLRRDANRFFGKHSIPFTVAIKDTFVSLTRTSD